MDTVIRHAEQKDISAIMRLLLQVDMVHHLGRPDIFKGPATKYTENELISIIADEKTPVFVAVGDDDLPVAHAFCIKKQVKNDNVLTDIRTLYIDDICVGETHRGQHIGKALYEYVLAYAKKEGFYNITLNVWSCNPNAAKFYEAMGLVPQKTTLEKIL